METKKVTLVLSAVVMTAMMLSSCNKKGCTDPLATNYDASAEKDDGSCMLPELGTEPGTDPDPILVHLNPNLTYGSVTDIDGNSYATIQIGTQTWMAENLRTTKYCNGDPIPNVTDGDEWSNLTTGAWSQYNNNTQYEIPYGKLYNWYAVDDSRNVCPCGWHVSTDAEWSTLIGYLDSSADLNIIIGIQSTTAGGKMKSSGTQYWQTPNTGATNESGFSGLPSGIRVGGFSNVGRLGRWWSSSESSTYFADVCELYYESGYVWTLYYDKPWGLSVRCLMD
jgi:uncharacterized protein (TIGR02145 family)